MICKSCQQADHAACEGARRHRTYCDCAHKSRLLATSREARAEIYVQQRAIGDLALDEIASG